MPQFSVYVGLGSNLGAREAALQEAIRRLGESGFSVVRASSFYETAPVGDTNQPWFLNAVVEARTEHPPKKALEVLMKIERALGRNRAAPDARPGGPRTLDLDLLLYGDRTIHEEALEIPHPRLHERRFVLVPLAEIAPEALHPALGKTARELLAACTDASEVKPQRR